ncbi:hybrid sensor histidine kinase/response regulator [Sphingobium sp. BHU LFT2]|uniref:ATP-binding response regulator n=1 Tax=Sphingobium sp. BHU LFT2 TaxID=2807634 RepID=UPI001BE7E26B|nr:hybrid sensor histidine kinase/response regulator [Sphingobium sp. BHU LFT2]MBT2246865.1 hybrid sensor histidine kinase/response regulator [Sphingobium sp. BHU LFT2]
MPTETHILLIDDDEVDRQAVRRALSASDLTWVLTEAANAAEGLALAGEKTFDCVLLDYRLPDADAFDVLGALLAPERGINAVLILTGETNPETALDLMRAGALDHLSKAELKPSGLARAIRYAKARRTFLAELEQAKREAEEKSRALDALNRQKALLLSIIAHDLRNPFQAIIGLSDSLSRTAAQKDPGKVQIRAQAVQEAAVQAHALMESLFDWAQLQMDSGDVELEMVDVAAIAQEATSVCRHTAEEKGVSVSFECGGGMVRAHRDMLATVLRNLVGNSIKFTPAGGSVTIACETGTDRRFVIHVRDSGVGMSQQAIDNLFRIDRRVTTPGTAGEKGSGLGLLLCRDLVERMGAKMEVVSNVGEGTAFSLVFDDLSEQ